MFTGKVIAAYVGWKPKHLVRKARPARKLVTLHLIDWKFFSHKARRLEIDNHVRSFFEQLHILGELACLLRFRFEEGHNSMLHFTKSLRVQFLALALVRNL